MVVLQVRTDVPAHTLVIAVEVVIGAQPQVLVAAVAEAVVVEIARWQEVLAHGARLAFRPLVVDRGIAMILPPLVAVADPEAEVGPLGAAQGVAGTLPVVAFAWLAVVVEVVGVGNDGQSREVAVAHGEEACQVASPLPTGEGRGGASSHLGVGNPAHHVLLLQSDVDDVALGLQVLDAEPLVLVGLLVVDGDVLYGVGRQVFEHELAVVAEELLAVEEQVVDELALVVDAAVALQLNAWQLTDEGVEHGAFGQDEGIGIIDNGVALVVELHTGGRNRHFGQHGRDGSQIERRQRPLVLATAYALQLVVDVGRAVAHEADAEYVLGGQGGHRETEFAGLPLVYLPIFTTAPPVMLGYSLLQHCAVGIEQLDGGTDERLVGADVLHLAVQLQLSDLPPLVVLHGDFTPVHLHLHGQPPTKPLHGFGCREPLHIGRRAQVAETVGEDVDGVFLLAAADALQGWEQGDKPVLLSQRHCRKHGVQGRNE